MIKDIISDAQSAKWDMDISFKELIDYNKDCMINREYRKSKHDDCYDGCCIYLKYPNKDEYEVMIALSDDGFVYLGDGTCENKQIIPIVEGLMELLMNKEYKKLMKENYRRLVEEGL